MTQAPNSTDPFEFLKSLWNPLGLPMPGMVTPTLDAADLDKRIADLKSVENWLNLNLNVLRMTIQGLEMQKATLSAMSGMADSARAMHDAMQKPPAGAAHASPAPSDAWWTIMQQAAEKTRNQPANPPEKNPTGRKK